jgi:hypothetical protein
MPNTLDIDDVILNYDPAAPHRRFKTGALGAALGPTGAALPEGIPWPAGAAPRPAALASPPPEADDLSRFRGYDAVVVTWTAAEASALATLFTPGIPLTSWYEYRHDIATYIPLVTGSGAPFNPRDPEMARYYHSLGLYFPLTVGSAKVLVFKSGLHLDYDGPATPVRQLMEELASTIQPRMFITTGTGGAIGADVALGDVVIAATVRFDCQQQFKSKPWASASYRASPLPTGTLANITPALTRVNASRIPGARSIPKIFASVGDAVVTADFFAFDDSTDHYKLQGLGQACDMDDAMVGNALAPQAALRWYSIRNASDTQISNPTGNMKQASQQAALIYAKYGGLTTAASVIATWAVIRAGTSN